MISKIGYWTIGFNNEGLLEPLCVIQKGLESNFACESIYEVSQRKKMTILLCDDKILEMKNGLSAIPHQNWYVSNYIFRANKREGIMEAINFVNFKYINS